MSRQTRTKVLLVEDDVLVRLALAEYLRSCGFIVIEAANGVEVKQVLLTVAAIAHMLADAQLAGPESGFALAQWVRRYRPGVRVVLTRSLASKTDAVAELCSDGDTRKHAAELLAQNIRAMRGGRSRGSGARTKVLRIGR
jgi:CheY-like chemotaxis protein